MAKYFVKFKCGHEDRVELFGKNTDREAKMAWMSENMLCSECYKKMLEEENAQASAEAKASGLPELEGSAKQVSWAVSIRKEKLAAMGKIMEQLLGKLPENFIVDANKQFGCNFVSAEELFSDVIDNYSKHDSAKFWIESRSEEVSERSFMLMAREYVMGGKR